MRHARLVSYASLAALALSLPLVACAGRVVGSESDSHADSATEGSDGSATSEGAGRRTTGSTSATSTGITSTTATATVAPSPTGTTMDEPDACCSDVGPVCLDVEAVDYDQACTQDADCSPVYSGQKCEGEPAGEATCACPNSAIATSSLAQYTSDSQLPPDGENIECSCPALGAVACVASRCTLLPLTWGADGG